MKSGIVKGNIVVFCKNWWDVSYQWVSGEKVNVNAGGLGER
jgi:hypothetical protein